MNQRIVLVIVSKLLFALVLFTPVVNAEPASPDTGTDNMSAAGVGAIVQCPVSATQPDTFALCATATCWTLDGVAYCKCDIMNEESISIAFEYEENGKTKNVCNLLLEGRKNGFTVSTYATPRQIETDYDPEKEKLGPPMGYYTCETVSAPQGYGAQCDGGICFNSTQGNNFPGLGYIGEDEIVCSCPPTLSTSPGFQIAGPWSCKPGAANENNQCCDQNYYDEMCGVTSVKNTGTVIAVNAPIGTAKVLSTMLDGQPPSFNACRFK